MGLNHISLRFAVLFGAEMIIKIVAFGVATWMRNGVVEQWPTGSTGYDGMVMMVATAQVTRSFGVHGVGWLTL